MPRRQLRERSAYQQKLLDPRWQKKRLQIFERDEWACQKCFSGEETLHVHHRYYRRDQDPWEYPMEALVTLCATCHEEETFERPLQEKTLLQALRQLGLFAIDIQDLAEGFRISSPKDRMTLEVLITALRCALKNDDVLEELINRHLFSVREQGLINKVCGGETE